MPRILYKSGFDASTFAPAGFLIVYANILHSCNLNTFICTRRVQYSNAVCCFRPKHQQFHLLLWFSTFCPFATNAKSLFAFCARTNEEIGVEINAGEELAFFPLRLMLFIFLCEPRVFTTRAAHKTGDYFLICCVWLNFAWARARFKIAKRPEKNLSFSASCTLIRGLKCNLQIVCFGRQTSAQQFGENKRRNCPQQ